jgi:hypothetical protein
MSAERGSGWNNRVFRPLLLAALAACVAALLADTVRILLPRWDGNVLIAAAVLAVLEASISLRIRRARRPAGGALVRFRLSELLLAVVLLKAAYYAGRGPGAFLADLQRWPQDPFVLFDGQTVAGLIVAFFAWDAATATLRELWRLESPTDPEGAVVEDGEATVLERVAGRYALGGAIVLVLIGAGQAVAGLAVGYTPAGWRLPAALVYFALGLVLLAQVRYAALQRRWALAGITAPPGLARRWARYSLAFFALAGLIALALPTGYAGGPLALAGELIGWIVWLVVLIVFIVSLPILWLLALLFPMTLGPRMPAPPQAGPPAAPPPGPLWLQFALTIGYWVLGLAVVVYALLSYLRERPELVETVAAVRPIAWLGALWAALVARWRRWRGRLGWPRLRPAAAGGGLTAVVGQLGSRWRLRGRTPRERILAYYASLMARAARAGLGRRPGETPYEYRSTLSNRLPAHETDAAGLTEAFVTARYSRELPEPEDARRARGWWERLRAALRRRL